jgi:L-lactate dehydrogenase complex protein LldG
VARGAIPETGSVLEDGGEGVGAALAFRAEKQIILIPPDRAGLSLAEALATGPQAGQAVTWLTGASRTADIEKVLVMGAQGPKELEMIVYQEEG